MQLFILFKNTIATNLELLRFTNLLWLTVSFIDFLSLLILIINYCKSSVCVIFILNLFKINKMKDLSLSNSCVNCDNLVFTEMTCGIHKVDVSEKYTCGEFEVSTQEA